MRMILIVYSLVLFTVAIVGAAPRPGWGARFGTGRNGGEGWGSGGYGGGNGCGNSGNSATRQLPTQTQQRPNQNSGNGWNRNQQNQGNRQPQPVPNQNENSQSSGSSTSDWQKAALNKHNELRARERANLNKMSWSADVARGAQQWAENCQFKHAGRSQRNGAGENIYMMSGDNDKAQLAKDGIQIWYDEKPNYNWQTKRCSGGECLHYTQIVWNKSVNLGCGIAVCDGGRWMFLVCRYDPPGNMNMDRETPY